MTFNIDIEMLDLKNTALLFSLANAIFSLKSDLLNHEHSWDSLNYNAQNSNGTRGTFSFQNDKIVFAIQKTYNGEPLIFLLDGIDNDSLNVFENETSLYLLQDVNGTKQPCIDCLVWGGSNNLYSNSKEETVLFLLEELLGISDFRMESILYYIWDAYEFSEEEKELLIFLFKEKIEKQTFSLNLKKLKVVVDENNEESYMESFKELDILLE